MGELLGGVDQGTLAHGGEFEVSLGWEEAGHCFDGVGLARRGMTLDPGGYLLVEQPRGEHQVQGFREPLLADQAAGCHFVGDSVEDAPQQRNTLHFG